MTLATTLQATAVRALKAYGALGTLTRVTEGTFDPSTGTSSAGTTLTAQVPAMLDASSFRTLGFKFGEALVQGGDLMATVAGGLTFEPAPGDTLTVPQGVFSVVATRPAYLGADAVTWELLVRR